MKKLITIILATMLTVTLSLGVSADIINQDSVPSEGSTSVTYEVAPTFTVTIPANVTLENNVTVSAEDVIVDEGKEVTVKLTATSGAENAFTLSNGNSGLVNYEVKKGDAALAIGDTVLAIDPSVSDEGTTELSFVCTTAIPKFAGTYTGTVTFTVAVEDK